MTLTQIEAITNEVYTALQNAGVPVDEFISRSRLDHGNSNYITIDSSRIKMRISDHQCISTHRALGEIHVMSYNVQECIDRVEAAYFPDRFEKAAFVNLSKINNVTCTASEVKEGDRVVSSFVSKKGKEMLNVLRPVISYQIYRK
jgi:hypothetical protein